MRHLIACIVILLVSGCSNEPEPRRPPVIAEVPVADHSMDEIKTAVLRANKQYNTECKLLPATNRCHEGSPLSWTDSTGTYE